MTTVNIYLNFDGNCEEAFQFYRSVFGGEFDYISRFGEIPPDENAPAIPEEMKNQIMHVSLPISKETSLMGSDTGEDMGPPFRQGNNFSISVGTTSRDEAQRIFEALGQGGQITMPLQQTFWSELFGMLTDRFGINWMVSLDAENQE
jgi:PhnB protein